MFRVILLGGGSKALSLGPWLRWQHTLAAASAGSSEYVVSWICHRRSVLSSSTYQWHSFPCNSTCSCDFMQCCKSHFSFLTEKLTTWQFKWHFFNLCNFLRVDWLILIPYKIFNEFIHFYHVSHKTKGELTSRNYRIIVYANIHTNFSIILNKLYNYSNNYTNMLKLMARTIHKGRIGLHFVHINTTLEFWLK